MESDIEGYLDLTEEQDGERVIVEEEPFFFEPMEMDWSLAPNF
ncbi:MAG: hypothetical protein ACTSQA_00955 [Candidatus Heimdallarchaeaceae archaeon]